MSFYATDNEKAEMIDVLLDCGADIDAKTRLVFLFYLFKSNMLMTPLHAAVIKGTSVLVELLITRGADMSAVDK